MSLLQKAIDRFGLPWSDLASGRPKTFSTFSPQQFYAALISSGVGSDFEVERLFALVVEKRFDEWRENENNWSNLVDAARTNSHFAVLAKAYSYYDEKATISEDLDFDEGGVWNENYSMKEVIEYLTPEVF